MNCEHKRCQAQWDVFDLDFEDSAVSGDNKFEGFPFGSH